MRRSYDESGESDTLSQRDTIASSISESISNNKTSSLKMPNLTTPQTKPLFEPYYYKNMNEI